MELKQQKVIRSIDFGIPEGFNRNYDFWFSETPPYLTLSPGEKNRQRMREYHKRKKELSRFTEQEQQELPFKD